MGGFTLFPEIGLFVIDQLGFEERWDMDLHDAHHLRALANCARTCRDWLHRSRVNLYRTVYIKNGASIQSLRDAFAATPFLPSLMETIKVEGTSVGRLHEVDRFIRSTRLPLLKRLELNPTGGNMSKEKIISLSNPVRAALFAVPYSSLHTLCISHVHVSRVLFLLRTLTSLREFRWRYIRGDDRKAVYPRRLRLSLLEVNSTAFIHIYSC